MPNVLEGEGAKSPQWSPSEGPAIARPPDRTELLLQPAAVSCEHSDSPLSPGFSFLTCKMRAGKKLLLNPASLKSLALCVMTHQIICSGKVGIEFTLHRTRNVPRTEACHQPINACRR